MNLVSVTESFSQQPKWETPVRSQPAIFQKQKGHRVIDSVAFRSILRSQKQNNASRKVALSVADCNEIIDRNYRFPAQFPGRIANIAALGLNSLRFKLDFEARGPSRNLGAERLPSLGCSLGDTLENPLQEVVHVLVLSFTWGERKREWESSCHQLEYV